ncbi:MAG: TM0106 family RecB-like putative nuclease [Candidatus Eisenbacteria bacterium]|nr:TM0106 family RecB-like putative nuclease [Candidatus Eisenbacteria bacterium]
MKLESGALRLAATDLANHLACVHLTMLDRGRAEGRWEPPDAYRPEAQVLAERGLEHERAYLAHLEGVGRRVTHMGEDADRTGALARTLAAMRAGADVIAQATLAEGRWLGRADVLLRVERPSDLGAWSYEALDTKLARDTKAGAILQLCLYSDLLRHAQGAWPEFLYVVPRRPEFPLETYRVADYIAYYRLVRRRLEAAVAADADPRTYPEPVPHCDICRWWPRCDRERRRDDHLCLVAGISRLQRTELEAHDIETLARLAVEPIPIRWRPARGARDAYGRVREQARVQLAGRTEARPLHELLPIEPGRGLACLPAPAPGDLFLDLEGDPYVDEGGMEFLFGWVVADPAPTGMLALDAVAPAYHCAWALDRAAERCGFEALIDAIMARLADDPNMHVHHFGAYEPGALKRLMGRHATRESEVDRLLRAGRFVDLHAIAKQALRASVEEYSIKKLEAHYGFERAEPLVNASAALRVIQRGLELNATVAPDDAHVTSVAAYNRDDCLSARALRDWLETLRAGVEADGTEVPRPAVEVGDPSEQVGEREQRAAALAERLLASIPADREQRTAEEHAVWLLAHMLDWHRREEKAPWWEYYRLRELPDDELMDETAALAGLEHVERVSAVRTPVDRYRFPAQETRIREGDKLHLPLPDGRRFGEVAAIDLAAAIVDVKKAGAVAPIHPTSVFAHDTVAAREQAEALMRLGAWVAEHGVDAPGDHRAARDLLLGRPPRLAAQAQGPLEREGEGGVRAARRLAVALDHGTLAIQGPPGSGKTFTGARMICDLVRAGRTVGVCAVSHRVVRNLLDGVVRAAAEERVPVACLQKVREVGELGDARVTEVTDNGDVLAALHGGRAQVVGGTAWLWAREDFSSAVDVLFVDEAGQMSLANVLAVAQGAGALVLLGDPQQLNQPIQGSHPDGTEVSALEHVLEGRSTIAEGRGLFLAETWRLPPEICAFTSELFYASRLEPRFEEGLQTITGSGAWDGAGLRFLPVEHAGRQSACPEEVEVVAAVMASLLAGGVTWRDRDGRTHGLALEDVLAIAPYNAQVADLIARLPRGARVGTVDKFQGQEAPVVLYSMTSSSPQDAPRGMDFLYDAHRFNVATSRAIRAGDDGRVAGGGSVVIALIGALVMAFAAGGASAAASAAPAIALPDTGVFAPVAAQGAERARRAGTVAPSDPAGVEALLDAGRADAAFASLGGLGPSGRAEDVVRARVLLDHVELSALRPVIERIAAQPAATELERWTLYQGLFAYDAAARVDSLTRARIAARAAGTPEWLAAGRLAYDQLNYARADSCFTSAFDALKAAPAGAAPRRGALRDSVVRSAAYTGMALVLQKRRDWDGSFGLLEQAIAQHVTATTLNALVETMIRLGRTDEAISAAQWAIRFDPYSDPAHYSLGNGYARKNYTELAAAYPAAFAGGAGAVALAHADSLLAAGRRAEARAAYDSVVAAHAGWADARVRLASLDFEDGRFRSARALAFAALAVCPEYGRAHAVLAKAIESERFAADVHRADYERRFAALPMPTIPGIERFVTNWASLSPRHRKRVALSIAPWRRFVPVLIEGGATYTIKPLYQRLSEVPGQEPLKDQRIDYDSRLWDDVRGSGGYHTVTGVEDVERIVFDRYNTVLHELTHQVHAVLTADQSRAIQELYRRAKARDDSTHDGFMSRYAGGSVYEYFAEGANALESPRRDAYDPREVVRERLTRMDPDLEARVKALFALTDVSPSYAVAYVNAGSDRVSRGRVDEAIGFYRKALARAPREETALQSLAQALTLANRGAPAVAAADSALAAYPASGGVVTAAADAYRRGGRGLAAALALLERSRATVRAEDRYQVDLARGNLAWTKGDAPAALAAYDAALAYQSDLPEALWGKAAALALTQRWDEAFAMYGRAVRVRTGVVDLRCDYARDLLRAGRTAAARAQLDEAKLLDVENPDAEALRGWADLAAGDVAGARRRAEQALAWGEWSDLACIVLAKAEAAAGNADAASRALAPLRERIAKDAPPEYVFRPRLAVWKSVHDLPAVEREMLR